MQYGNPVTFRQAIYQSYYVQRPEVPVEILGRILPSVDTRARPAELAMQKAGSPPAGAARMLAAPAPPPAPLPQQEVMAQAADQVQAAEGVEATIFQLATPVVLAAGHTASVPIIDRSIPAERVDLATANDTHPLSAIRITNDTGASMPAGVLTLYDASGAATFAGDARLGGLPAGEQPAAVVRPGSAHHGRARAAPGRRRWHRSPPPRACCTSPRGSARCCG